MQALTIKQPFAHLVASGIKTIENRTWYTKHRGRIYIHAGASAIQHKDFYIHLTEKQVIAALNSYNGLWPEFKTSTIIGEVSIINCVKDSPSIWALPNHWHWVLGDAVLYKNPIENVRGALSLWHFDNSKIKV